MNTPASVRASALSRLGRSAATLGLTLAVMLLLAIAALGWLPSAPSLFSAFSSADSDKLPPGVGIATLLVILLGPGLVVFWLRRRGWLTGRVLLAGWAALLVTGIWLAWDDPVLRQPLPMEEFSPAFPGAEQSYGVLMRYGKLSKDPAAAAFVARKPAVPFIGAKATDAAKWRDFLTTNRAALETDWIALEPERRWLDELAGFDRIGDLTQASLAADIPRFDVWRSLSQRTAAHASLLAIDGRGDEAIDALLPLIEVSRKLEPSSRTLVRTMIARVVQRQALEATNFVLDTAPVSADRKARLATALGTVNAAAGARRLVLMEYAAFAPIFGQMRLGEIRAHPPLPALIRHPLNGLSALLYNPNATANRYGNAAFELAALAEQRDLGTFAVRQKTFFDRATVAGGLKNAGGRLMLASFIPSYDKILKSYWELEDLRTTLADRLRA